MNKMKPFGKKYTWNEGIFANLFTKFAVNTIGRSDNIDDLLLDKFDWEEDALTIQFASTKPDQAGEITADRKRLFANPYKPEICTILSLSIHTWCTRRSSTDECKFLFNGINQDTRYYQILTHTLEEIDPGINLGCERDSIGTHSNRKFGETITMAHIDGGTRVMVLQRAGQSLFLPYIVN